MKPTSHRSTVIVTTDGAGIASHAGSAALIELADRLGSTSAPSVVTISVLRRLVGFTFKVLSSGGCWDV